jgi:hypothetical protein
MAAAFSGIAAGVLLERRQVAKQDDMPANEVRP